MVLEIVAVLTGRLISDQYKLGLGIVVFGGIVCALGAWALGCNVALVTMVGLALCAVVCLVAAVVLAILSVASGPRDGRKR